MSLRQFFGSSSCIWLLGGERSGLARGEHSGLPMFLLANALILPKKLLLLQLFDCFCGEGLRGLVPESRLYTGDWMTLLVLRAFAAMRDCLFIVFFRFKGVSVKTGL